MFHLSRSILYYVRGRITRVHASFATLTLTSKNGPISSAGNVMFTRACVRENVRASLCVRCVVLLKLPMALLVSLLRRNTQLGIITAEKAHIEMCLSQGEAVTCTLGYRGRHLYTRLLRL